MRSIESSAKTMEEAVMQGLEKLGVSLGDVSIDIMDEGSKGLFGLIGGKPARVRLTVKEGAEDPDILSTLSIRDDEPSPAVDRAPKEKAQPREKTDRAPKQEKPVTEKIIQKSAPVQKSEKPAKMNVPEKKNAPAPQATVSTAYADSVLCDPETAAAKAQRFLMDVTHMMGVEVSVDATTDAEGNVRVDMHGDTLGILIGRRGETLDALQYLTSLNVNRGKDEYTRVTIDTENYRSKREEALTRLANRMANRAIKTGRKVVMEPMNPYERRILHSALQQNEAVTTHSEGDEPNRHVVITLK